MTPQGAEKLKAELRQLRDVERPEIVRVVAWAASNGDRSENADYIYGKRRMREIDKRIEYLTKRLAILEIVDPTLQKGEKIFFGATVTIEDEAGHEKIFCIVGEDETNPAKNHISWLSPIGKALLNRSQGDTVTIQTPKGPAEVEIIRVQYRAIA